jgi:hypothetical protein
MASKYALKTKDNINIFFIFLIFGNNTADMYPSGKNRTTFPNMLEIPIILSPPDMEREYSAIVANGTIFRPRPDGGSPWNRVILKSAKRYIANSANKIIVAALWLVFFICDPPCDFAPNTILRYKRINAPNSVCGGGQKTARPFALIF